MSFENFTVRVSSVDSDLVVDVRLGTTSVLSKTIAPDHAGLLVLTGDLQALQGAQVLLDPSLSSDDKGFVNSAYTLATLGWHSSPGGEA